MLKLADFKEKTVLIMGLGLHGGGVGAAAFFARLGSRVVVTDLKARQELLPSLAKLKRWKTITYHLGGHRREDFKSADYVIKNPGVAEKSPFLAVARRAHARILSDIEVFSQTCPAPIVGITGTKGKSTATWLFGEFLKAGLKKRIWVGGNIRKSALDFLPRVRGRDLVILELSSFQLDSLTHSRVSPHIALITSVFPDHLNRYASMAAYAASKAGIFAYQKMGDLLFINGRDQTLIRLARRARSRVIRYDPARVVAPFRTAIAHSIPSYHDPNIAGAIAMAKHLGVEDSAIRAVLRRFRGVPGRMQLVRRIGGVEFINDTTATNPGAATRAIMATKKRISKHGLHVIAGGYDKGLAVGEFARALKRHAASIILLPGTATNKMEQKLPGGRGLKTFSAKTMHEAVWHAYRNAKPGDVILLSPGAASFGLFINEFDRGDQFVQAVRRIRSSTHRMALT